MNNRKRYLSLAILAVLAIALAAWSAVPDTPVIRVAVGETKVVRFPGGITRIALGTDGLATLTVTAREEIMINGTKAGVTTLHIWDDNRDVRLYSLQVLTREQLFISDAEKIQGAYDIAVAAQRDGRMMIRGFIRDNGIRLKVLNLARVYFTDVMDGLLLPGEDPPLTADQTEGQLTQLENAVITKLFAPRSRAASDLNTVLTQMLSENGRIIVDASTNSLIVIDTPQNVETIGRFIKRLDEQTTAQVMIEAKFVELSEYAREALGMTWSAGIALAPEEVGGAHVAADPAATGLGTFSGNVGDNSNGQASIVLASPTGTLNDLVNMMGHMKGTSISATLTALEKEGRINTLSAPQVTTINGMPATVDITNSQAYISSYNFIYDANGNIVGGSPVLSTIESGITLNVTPQIGKDDVITLLVTPTIRILQSPMASGGNSDYPIQLPIVDERTTTVTVMLKDGGTLVIAGLMNQQTASGENGIPGLSRIPFFGRLFQRTESTENKRNLSIFITAHVIKYGQTGTTDAGAN